MSEPTRVSADIQLMISDLIANARHIDSEFPIKAMKCRAKVDELKTELLQRIGKLEQPK